MKTISFVGSISGDGECFLWKNVSKEDKIDLIGEKNYHSDWVLEEDFQKECWQRLNNGEKFDQNVVDRIMQQVYPGDVMIALGCYKDKTYRFTVTAEEIPPKVA